MAMVTQFTNSCSTSIWTTRYGHCCSGEGIRGEKLTGPLLLSSTVMESETLVNTCSQLSLSVDAQTEDTERQDGGDPHGSLTDTRHPGKEGKTKMLFRGDATRQGDGGLVRLHGSQGQSTAESGALTRALTGPVSREKANTVCSRPPL